MKDRGWIERRANELLESLASGVTLVAASKTRTPEEVAAAARGGIGVFGENYVQEAKAKIEALEHSAAAGGVAWHMIGHLQRNKVRDAVRLFDAIQTVDSMRLATKISDECAKIGREMPILIEINSAREPQKAGVLPDDAEALVREIAPLPAIRVQGLMTMGPFTDDPEQLRPLFRLTKELFDRLAAAGIPGLEMTTLSMGMSDSYPIAIEEASTMVRLGTVLFGPRG